MSNQLMLSAAAAGTFNCMKSNPDCQNSEEDWIQKPRNEASYEELQVFWESRLRSLEQWVCELLIKNQELRSRLAPVTETNG